MFTSSLSVKRQPSATDSLPVSDDVCRSLLYSTRSSGVGKEFASNEYERRSTHSEGLGPAAGELFLLPRHLPLRFVVSWLMLLTLLLFVLVYHVPCYTSSYVKRKAVLDHFLGNDYLFKGAGDIVRHPTVYVHSRKDALSRMEDFVSVFYGLASAAEEELRHHYYRRADAGDGLGFLRSVLHSEPPERVEKVDRFLTHVMNNQISDVEGEISAFDEWSNVHMDVELFTFSTREHSGPTDLKKFSINVTAEEPLGPFATEYRDWIDDTDNISGADRKISGVNTDAEAATEFSSGAVNDVPVKAACSPRRSGLSGRYYSPCRQRIKRNDSNSSGSFFFSLMDNTHRVRLYGSLPQVVVESSDDYKSTCGFGMVVFQWNVEANFLFRRGGFVEVTYHLTSTARYVGPRYDPRFLVAAVLCLLAFVDMVIRFRALSLGTLWRRATAEGDERGGSHRTDDGADRVVSDERSCRLDRSGANSPLRTSEAAEDGHSPTARALECLRRWVERRDREGGAPRPARDQGTRDTQRAGFMNLYEQWHRRLQEGADGWHFVGLVADVLVLLYIALFCRQLRGATLSCFFNAVENITLGVAAFFVCVNLLSQSRYFPEMYFNVQAMLRLISNLLLGMLSMFPLFVGFAIFYFLVFGPHSDGRFSDMSYFFMTLYFIMFGDALVPAIASAGGSSFPLTTFLANTVTVFYILIVIVALNLAMSITQHQWVRQRRKIGGKDTLLTFRTREDVKAEIIEDIIENIDVLLQLDSHEEHGGENKLRTAFGASCGSLVRGEADIAPGAEDS